MDADARTDEVGEVRELGTNQVRNLDRIPFVADKQILIGRKRLDALGEALDEIFRISAGSLVSDRVDDAEHVLGAMIDFAHEELLLFLTLPAFSNVLNSAAEADDPPLMPRARKISNSISLYPADLAVSPPYPVLEMDVLLRIGRIKRLLAVRLAPFPRRPMPPVHPIFHWSLIHCHRDN